MKKLPTIFIELDESVHALARFVNVPCSSDPAILILSMPNLGMKYR